MPQLEKLTVNRFEAAEMLSISLRTLDYLLSSGELKARRVGRRVLITREELQRFIRKDHALPDKGRSDQSAQ